ncbi:MAG: D-glycero-beta-D-manno-heptose 1-phosphate adenylyltransferase, partial [Bacteroidetes bacterium]
VLEALKHIDLVILFDEETPERLIQQIRPDVLVKGGDYTVNQIAGSEFVLQNGGEVKIIPLTEGYSTSAIEQKIIETFGKS